MAEASWQQDPSGRHELRFWDGSAWTDHVSDNGVQGADSIETAASAATASTAMQPSSTNVLWEGQRESLTAAATSGKVVSGRYQLTDDALRFEAGLLSTSAEVIPLWVITDVDLKQSMTQKARGVGDLQVRLDPSGSRFGQRTVLLQSIKDPRTVRDLLAGQANKMRLAMLERQHTLEVERRQAGATSISVGHTGPGAADPPADSGPSVLDQLKQLGELRDAGVLTEEEFAEQKNKLLNG